MRHSLTTYVKKDIWWMPRNYLRGCSSRAIKDTHASITHSFTFCDLWFLSKGDMEGALGFYFEHKGKGISPDFLGFLRLIRGLCAKGRMEEARSILREMLSGSIKEAVTVLNEVGSVFFPVEKWFGPFHESQELLPLSELNGFSSVSSSTVSSCEEMIWIWHL
ncbi:hypothetical protein POTOM_056580 [Populus tomentosa]|uniref:Pentatricopeptide repeat-containing protein n=1 Tax=Populus tomentosa TaxID=118781 RepID=A0A8X8BYG7_POPTO|nr:hypothetical protein POTOM_056580 [Populus tomentosa]